MTRVIPLPQDLPIPPLGRVIWWGGPPVVRGIGRLAFSLRVESHGPLPQPPYVIAANHYSHLDPPVIGSAVGRAIRYVALDELVDASRFLAWVMPTFGAIALSRSRLPIGTLRTALSRLAQGEIVGLFPEGTRVTRWGDQEPKRGAAWLACRAGVPLVPVAVIGTDRVLGVDNRLRRGEIRVVIGSPWVPDGDTPTSLTARWSSWMETQLGVG